MTMKKAAAKTNKSKNQRILNWGTNALLFLTNFFLMYFIWVVLAPGVTGIARLFPCWLLAFGMTWVMVRLTKITARLFLTLAFLGLLFFVLLSRG
jgi:hypothetical protein